MCEYDFIGVGYDKEEDISTITVMGKLPNGKIKMLVGYNDEQADKLYRMVTEQGYLKEHNRKIYNKALDDIFEFLKTKRDKKAMKVNLDDLEIRKYKEQLKVGVESE